MTSSEPVRFGQIGSGWITEQHLAAYGAVAQIAVVGLADVARDRGGRPGRGQAIAERHGLSYHADHRALLADDRVEAVMVALPNAMHAEVTLQALDAGKHVVVEKPLCFTLAEADAIQQRAAARGLVVGYAEELCYCPKFVRARELVNAGAIGSLFWIEQTEIHEGPYSDWFFDPELAGGGALMDMGCHAIEYARWMFDKAPVTSVTAQMATYVHGARGPLEDHVSLHLEFEGGRAARLLAGWTKKGGMDSLARLVGTDGVLDVDLLKGTGLSLFSSRGVDEAEVAAGWTTPDYEWLWQNGYPQEMADFARAIRSGTVPVETAADGRATLEIMWAAYVSAAEGRTVRLPFQPDPKWRYPAQPWVERRG